MPLPIVRLVFMWKATEICVIFFKHKVQSKLHNYGCWKIDNHWIPCYGMLDAVSKPGYCSSHSWEVFADEVFIGIREILLKFSRSLLL